jgi:hypothetical protein
MISHDQADVPHLLTNATTPTLSCPDCKLVGPHLRHRSRSLYGSRESLTNSQAAGPRTRMSILNKTTRHVRASRSLLSCIQQRLSARTTTKKRPNTPSAAGANKTTYREGWILTKSTLQNNLHSFRIQREKEIAETVHIKVQRHFISGIRASRGADGTANTGLRGTDDTSEFRSHSGRALSV